MISFPGSHLYGRSNLYLRSRVDAVKLCSHYRSCNPAASAPLRIRYRSASVVALIGNVPGGLRAGPEDHLSSRRAGRGANDNERATWNLMERETWHSS